MKKFTLALLFLFLNCAEEQETISKIEVEKEIKINPDEASQVVDYANIAEIESLTVLETPDEYPIGTYDKVLVTKENFIVLDKLTSSIFIFNKKGEFISRISKRGKGPDEYLSIKNISVSEGNIINVVDYSSRKIRKYNFNGEQIGVTKTDAWPDDFFENGAYSYLSFYSAYLAEENEMFYINVLSDKKNTGYFPFKQTISNSAKTPRIFFSDPNEGVLFRRHYDDNIYRLIGDNIKIAYQIKFGNYSFPTEKLLEAKSLEEYDDIVEKEGNIGNISRIFLTDEYLYFKYQNKGNNINTYIKNLNSGVNYHYKASKSSKPARITPFAIASDSGYFYALLNPWYYNQEGLDKINKQYNFDLKLESTNNVLIKYKFTF